MALAVGPAMQFHPSPLSFLTATPLRSRSSNGTDFCGLSQRLRPSLLRTRGSCWARGRALGEEEAALGSCSAGTGLAMGMHVAFARSGGDTGVCCRGNRRAGYTSARLSCGSEWRWQRNCLIRFFLPQGVRASESDALVRVRTCHWMERDVAGPVRQGVCCWKSPPWMEHGLHTSVRPAAQAPSLSL